MFPYRPVRPALSEFISHKAKAALLFSGSLIVGSIFLWCSNDHIGFGHQQVVDAQVYTHAQTLITLKTGRKMNMFCVGRGSPTVLMEAGLGSNNMTWRHVQLPVAALTRACSYDRAGYGFSDPADRPSDAISAVNDLYDLLRSAKIPLPVVLVGHSRGGLYVTLYTELHPSDVSGLVLVDPSFAFQDRAFDATQTQQERGAKWTKYSADLGYIQNCLEQSHNGILNSNCLANLPYTDPTLQRELVKQFQSPKYWETVLSERISAHGSSENRRLSADDLEMLPGGPHFGALPLIVLTSEALDSPTWRAGHNALAKASTRGSSIFVEHSGHYIQDEKPSAVIDAIKAVISMARQ